MRERDRVRIEVDAGADTKTTTKMWKRKNKGKKKQVTIETHTWLRPCFFVLSVSMSLLYLGFSLLSLKVLGV